MSIFSAAPRLYIGLQQWQVVSKHVICQMRTDICMTVMERIEKKVEQGILMCWKCKQIRENVMCPEMCCLITFHSQERIFCVEQLSME